MVEQGLEHCVWGGGQAHNRSVTYALAFACPALLLCVVGLWDPQAPCPLAAGCSGPSSRPQATPSPRLPFSTG